MALLLRRLRETEGAARPLVCNDVRAATSHLGLRVDTE